METIIPDRLIDLLSISISLSLIVMSLIQQFKNLESVKKTYQIWILNLFLSFLIGIPFGNYFYNLTILESMWISLFTFIGAPTLYETFKKQTIVNYTPKSLNSSVTISLENEIKTKNYKN